MADTDLIERAEEEELLEEEILSDALYAEQEIYRSQQLLGDLAEEGKKYKKPSAIKYSILFFLSLTQDSVDLLDLTGIGAFITTIASFVLSGLIIFIMWLTNTKYKRASNYTKELEEIVPVIQANIARATRVALNVSRVSRHIPGMKKVARHIPRVLAKTRRFVRRSPLTKVFVSNVLDIVPFLGLLPLSTISIFLAYRDERKVYNNARQAAEEIF